MHRNALVTWSQQKFSSLDLNSPLEFFSIQNYCLLRNNARIFLNSLSIFSNLWFINFAIRVATEFQLLNFYFPGFSVKVFRIFRFTYLKFIGNAKLVNVLTILLNGWTINNWKLKFAFGYFFIHRKIFLCHKKKLIIETVHNFNILREFHF